jgi:hypothetical protein
VDISETVITIYRHWSVFWASIATMAAFWGITPFQAAMLSTNTVQFDSRLRIDVSTSPGPSDLGLTFAYSAYAIIFLNESIPPYMTKDYSLIPFEPEVLDAHNTSTYQTVTSRTTLYTLDLSCDDIPELPANVTSNNWSYWGENSRCNVTGDIAVMFPTGNQVVGQPDEDLGANGTIAKPFDIFFKIDDEKQRTCVFDGSFYAAFAQNKFNENDPPGNVTRIVCRQRYYVQNVTATVDWPQRTVQAVIDSEPQQEISWLPWLDLESFAYGFKDNYLMDSPDDQLPRNGLPATDWPDGTEHLLYRDIKVKTNNTVQFVPNLAIAALDLPNANYLDPEALQETFLAAYRILYGRAVSDIQQYSPFQATQSTDGYLTYQTQALQIVPAIAYLVEGLLFFNFLIAIILFFLLRRRNRNLRFDPTTLAAMMSLSADNPTFLVRLKDLDVATEKELTHTIQNETFALLIAERQSGFTTSAPVGTPPQTQQNPTIRNVKNVKPKTLSFWSLSIFLTFQLGALIVLAVLNSLSIPYGMYCHCHSLSIFKWYSEPRFKVYLNHPTTLLYSKYS